MRFPGNSQGFFFANDEDMDAPSGWCKQGPYKSEKVEKKDLEDVASPLFVLDTVRTRFRQPMTLNHL